MTPALVLALGALQLDMDIAQLQAAAPEARWEAVQVSPYTQRVFSMRSTQPLVLAGVPFAMQAEVGYYHRRWELQATLPPTEPAACEQAVLGVLAALEPQLGPFTSRLPVTTPGKPGNLQWHAQQGPNGLMVVPAMGAGTAGETRGEVVAFGSGSRALVEAFDNKDRPRPRKTLLAGRAPRFDLSAFQRLPDQRVNADGRFDAGACELRLQLARETTPPAPVEFDTTKARVVHQPSVAERHFELPDELARLPAPVEVALKCRIYRQLGDVNGCDIVGTVPPAAPLTAIMETYAHRLARAMVFDVGSVDRDDPQAMVGIVRVKLDPADRRPIDFLEAQRTPLAQVVFTAQLGEDEQVVPLVHQNWGSAEGTNPPHGTVLEVTLTCQIQGDGSLLCGGGQWTQPPGDDAFRRRLEHDAQRLAAYRFLVAAKLKDGTASAGRVIPLSLRFRT